MLTGWIIEPLPGCSVRWKVSWFIGSEVEWTTVFQAPRAATFPFSRSASHITGYQCTDFAEIQIDPAVNQSFHVKRRVLNLVERLENADYVVTNKTSGDTEGLFCITRHTVHVADRGSALSGPGRC